MLITYGGLSQAATLIAEGGRGYKGYSLHLKGGGPGWWGSFSNAKNRD